jgi:SAM-dependent methyltransferase
MNIRLICPHDRALLNELSDGNFACEPCGRRYPVDNGVVRLLERTDEFYEGAYNNQVGFLPKNETLWCVWPLWLITSGYPWAVRSFVREGATVVELGCAGGVRYFGQRYRMVGCDLSLSSLHNLHFYQRRVQADASACLPLPDGSVDAVVSSYFWEHISPEVKPAILRECERILRPGGKIIFLYDVETENSLIRRYRTKDRALYYRLFIEGDGHLGYQRPSDNIALFRAAGFRVIEQRGMEKTWLQSPSTYAKLEQFGGRFSTILGLGRRLGQSPWFYPYTALLRFADSLIGPLLRDDLARIELVVCEKTAA